ncbi:MAG: hypothetical protein WCG66_04500 [bacterium]
MNDRRHIRAMALPLVLWCIAFLAGLVVLTGGLVRNWIENESLAERKFVARQMALSGIALGLNPAIENGSPLLRHGTRDGEGYEVKLSNESARINPNFWIQSGNRSILSNLFANWGAKLEVADAAIDSLQDWIDADDFVSLKGAERGEYERAGRPGYPANRPLKHIREMESVLNMGPLLASKQGWQDVFTVWYSGKINIQHATEPLLTALAELTPTQCRSLTEMRAGPDGIENTADDQKFASIEAVADFLGVNGKQRSKLLEFFDTSGDVRRIESTGWCGGIPHRIVVIAASGSGGQLMSWEEK